jgi:hypothetical protein
MKKLALVLTLTILALAGSAMAQEWADNVGVYFDPAGVQNCSSAAPLTPFPGYLVLTHVAAADVNAWELKLLFDNVLQLNLAPRGSAVDVAMVEGEHIVGLAYPLPVVGGTVVVADLTLMVTNANPASIGIDGVFFHSLQTRVPAAQGSETAIFELRPISAPGNPVMVINNGCAVATETSSFGSLKSLFR